MIEFSLFNLWYTVSILVNCHTPFWVWISFSTFHSVCFQNHQISLSVPFMWSPLQASVPLGHISFFKNPSSLKSIHLPSLTSSGCNKLRWLQQCPHPMILYDSTNIRIWRRRRPPTPVLLPGKPHGRRSLVGCSPWGREELDMTERLHFHFSLSCIGEGNGNPLQCSCLENPRDGGAWWAAVYGVAQSRTRPKRLSSSSNIRIRFHLRKYLFLFPAALRSFLASSRFHLPIFITCHRFIPGR